MLFARVDDEQRRSGGSAFGARTLQRVNWRRQWPLGAIYFLIPWANVGFPLLTGPLLLARGYALNEALLFVALAAVGPAFGALFAGLVIDRISRRLALGLAVVGMLIAFVAFISVSSAVGLMVAVIAFGVGSAVLVAVLTLYAAEVFPAEVRTAATSVAWSINRVASVIAPLVLFALVNPASLFTALWPICVALALSLVAIVLLKDDGAARRVVD
jgi:putative MFS transporter